MIVPGPLTLEQRKKSRHYYNFYSVLNGFSYMCLGETVIVLFAVHLNAPDKLIAAIGAAMYVGFVMLPLGIVRTRQVGAAASQADFWVSRCLSALLVFASAFLMGISHWLAWSVLLLGALLFYGFRAAGVVMVQPLIGEITTDEDRGRFIGSTTALFYIFGLAAMLTISLLLSWRDSIVWLEGVILAGSVLGIAASGFLRNICETPVLRESAKAPVLPQLIAVFRTPIIMRQICAGFMFNVLLILTQSMSLLAVKRGFGVSDSHALLFSLAQFTAAIAASQVSGKFAAKYGPRRLLITAYVMFASIGLFWIFAPQPGGQGMFQWLAPLCAFLLIGSASVISGNSMTHYFLMSVPKEKQVGASVFVNVCAGAGAGITGLAAASAFLSLARHCAGAEASQIDMFRWYFGFVAVLALIGFVFPLRLPAVLHSYRAEHSDDEFRKTVQTVSGKFN